MNASPLQSGNFSEVTVMDPNVTNLKSNDHSINAQQQVNKQGDFLHKVKSEIAKKQLVEANANNQASQEDYAAPDPSEYICDEEVI